MSLKGEKQKKGADALFHFYGIGKNKE